MIQSPTRVQQYHPHAWPEERRRGRRIRRILGPIVLSVLACMACGVTDDDNLPPDVQDPTILQTQAGALARYREVIAEFPAVFDAVLTIGGILTDELAGLPIPLQTEGPYTGLDSRLNTSGFSLRLSDRLHRLRAQAREARGFLRSYAPATSPALSAHLYALEGYADVFLADLFCSGIPLSTVEFDGDYTAAAGSSTADVYRHAEALFDSALMVASDSARIQHFSAIGRARALLSRGLYPEAAAGLAAVPDNYTYQIALAYAGPTIPATIADSANLFLIARGLLPREGAPSMGNLEGGNGLPYRTGNDPRTSAQARGQDQRGNTFFLPAKYSVNSPVTLTVANGVAARLIEAEAALHAGATETWLTKLNALRTDGTFDTQPTADPNDDPGNTDTLWHAGSGGVARLRPLEDPGSDVARVDLLFRERAYWLYLAGYRQGDLRRLVREYVRAPETVYPIGGYPGGIGLYGPEVVILVPQQEIELNPNYSGCFHKDA